MHPHSDIESLFLGRSLSLLPRFRHWILIHCFFTNTIHSSTLQLPLWAAIKPPRRAPFRTLSPIGKGSIHKTGLRSSPGIFPAVDRNIKIASSNDACITFWHREDVNQIGRIWDTILAVAILYGANMRPNTFLHSNNFLGEGADPPPQDPPTRRLQRLECLRHRFVRSVSSQNSLKYAWGSSSDVDTTWHLRM